MKKSIVLVQALLLCLFFVSSASAQDWAKLGRYRSQNEALARPADSVTRVVFMGNSITQGWVEIHPEYFGEKAGGFQLIGRGIGGQTTPQMLVRFRQDVIALHPKAVVILAGTNDIAGNTGPMRIEDIAANIFSMVELSVVHGIAPIVCSVLPVFDYRWKSGMEPAGKIMALNALLKEYCLRKEIAYVDFHSILADENFGLPEKYSADGVHPNKECYLIMEGILDKILVLTK